MNSTSMETTPRARSGSGAAAVRSIKRILEVLAMVAVIVAMAGFFGQGRFKATSHFEQADTTVWYCAGEAVNERADPYRVEPLRSCELRNEPSRSYPWVEPAPLPGYALATFGLMARLPFPVARTLWFYLLVAAVVTAALLLAKLARVPALAVLLCLALVDGYFNLLYGELPPIAVAALVISAAFGASQRYTAAALAGAVAMLEPHIGLPACLAMFAWWPKTRLPFIVGGTVLAGISIAAIGVQANIEYFTSLLPLQAAAEIAAQDQYSLTRVLHLFGFSDRVALSAGTASYLGMTALGVAIARRLAAAVQSDALIALMPPAMALLGGPFVHDLQMAAAIPAALILASSTRPPLLLRAAALGAIVFPWHAWSIAGLRGQTGILELAGVAAALLIATRTKPVAARVAAAFAGMLVCAVLGSAIESVPRARLGPPPIVLAAATAPGDSSAANWAAHVSQMPSYSIPDARDVSEKIPVWLALIALTGSGIMLSRRTASARRAKGRPARRISPSARLKRDRSYRC